MSVHTTHIEQQSNTINEESYAYKKSATATFVSKKIMETNEEKKSIRQKS